MQNIAGKKTCRFNEYFTQERKKEQGKLWLRVDEELKVD